MTKDRKGERVYLELAKEDELMEARSAAAEIYARFCEWWEDPATYRRERGEWTDPRGIPVPKAQFELGKDPGSDWQARRVGEAGRQAFAILQAEGRIRLMDYGDENFYVLPIPPPKKEPKPDVTLIGKGPKPARPDENALSDTERVFLAELRASSEPLQAKELARAAGCSLDHARDLLRPSRALRKIHGVKHRSGSGYYVPA